jgi:hypothetical protein
MKKYIADSFEKIGGLATEVLLANGNSKNYIHVKSNQSLSLAQRKDDVLYGILDQYTGENITLSKVTGTPTVDGIIYFQIGSEYFKRNYTQINVKWFGAKGDGVNDDTTAIQNAVNACYEKFDTCYLPNGTYKTTDTILITKGITLKGESIYKTIISIASVTRKVAVKINVNSWDVRGGGLDTFSINGNDTCDGVLINVEDGWSINQAIYQNIKILHSVLGFETRRVGGQNNLYICIFRNIAIEQGIKEGGFKLHGGSYNVIEQLSASDGLVNTYYGFDISQVGSSIINCTTDSYSTIDNGFGMTKNFVCETTPYNNSIPTLLAGALTIFGGNYENLTFINIDKARYETYICFKDRHVNVRSIYANSLTFTPPDYPFSMIQPNGSGIIENFESVQPITNKVEAYVSAAILEGYTFIDCNQITNLNKVGVKKVTSLPVASEKFRGNKLLLKGTSNLNDIEYLCIKNEYEAYEWIKTNSQLTNETFTAFNLNTVNSKGKFFATPLLSTSTNMFPTINNANAVLSVDMYDGGAGNEFGQLGFNGAGEIYHRFSIGTWKKVLKEDTVIKLKSYTVATLPTGTLGDIAMVTDATAPTYLGTLTGGGAVNCPVFYNGTIWVSK